MEAAEIVFVGGPVVTMDATRSITDAAAVSGDRIVAVGEAAVSELVGPRTEVVELGGRALLPGFQDAHVHPLYGGLQLVRCDLSDCADERECLERIGRYVTEHPDTDWILGGGWEVGLFSGGCPDAHELDKVTGDRPAYLVNEDQHGAWVNSAALRLAGIDRDTPDPRGGRIERDPGGAPSGTLHETATRLVAEHIPPTPRSEYRQALLRAQRHLHGCGITTWHDAILGAYLGYPDPVETYLELEDRELLTARVTGSLWWDTERGTEQLDELVERRAAINRDRFRPASAKIMLDGICENFTAAMLNPFLGDRGHGISNLDTSALSETVRLLDQQGFPVHFHAVGDRAVRQALDAVEAARESNHTDLRHQIAHLQVVHPDDVPRFRSLGVTANIQPEWAHNDLAMTELTLPYLPPASRIRQYPFRELRLAGVTLAAGSDWPVSPADPLRGIHMAVNRREPDGEAAPLLPEQRIELTDALAAATIGSAWAHSLDGDSGSIEIGKAADLIVLGADPFALPPTDVGHIEVDLTMVGGRIVHERSR